ncbi:uncharacterized protein LOC126898603 isoform X2 [Daktulosphaira vitifoliae]|uniref:uncharacterized protein LOC126898603 isoform X2 n=1 Tax=Daktulosphaira vitifoliae TaxID=58002 RepID=UPI0021AA65E2|nr:uncharacterized protein LOC126898603 isoform X2 [Daktulosphaira vitifoliae]
MKLTLNDTSVDTIETLEITNAIFERYNWESIKDVNHIKYRNIKYSLQKIKMIDTKIIDHNWVFKRIRLMTCFLGCTYANSLLTILFFYERVYLMCKDTLIKEPMNGYNCMVNFLKSFYSLATMSNIMQSAMNALDELHKKQWSLLIIPRFILRNTFDKLITVSDFYKIEKVSMVNPKMNKTFYQSIERFFEKVKEDLNLDIKCYCSLILEDNHSLWNMFISFYEFYPLKDTPSFPLYEHLIEIIKEIQISTLINKFTKLGFKFIANTNKANIMINI